MKYVIPLAYTPGAGDKRLLAPLPKDVCRQSTGEFWDDFCEKKIIVKSNSLKKGGFVSSFVRTPMRTGIMMYVYTCHKIFPN